MYKRIFHARTGINILWALCLWKQPVVQVFSCFVFPITFIQLSHFVSQARAMRCGFSRLMRNLSRNREANSSSTSRPSLDSVTVISCWVRRVWSSSHSRSSALEVPMARIHAWGGLITALKPLIPNIPRLDILPPREMEKVGRKGQYEKRDSTHITSLVKLSREENA